MKAQKVERRPTAESSPRKKFYFQLRGQDKDVKLELSKGLFGFDIHVSASEAIRLSGRKTFIVPRSLWRISSVGHVEGGIGVEIFFKGTSERERKRG